LGATTTAIFEAQAPVLTPEDHAEIRDNEALLRFYTHPLNRILLRSRPRDDTPKRESPLVSSRQNILGEYVCEHCGKKFLTLDFLWHGRTDRSYLCNQIVPETRLRPELDLPRPRALDYDGPEPWPSVVRVIGCNTVSTSLHGKEVGWPPYTEKIHIGKQHGAQPDQFDDAADRGVRVEPDVDSSDIEAGISQHSVRASWKYPESPRNWIRKCPRHNPSSYSAWQGPATPWPGANKDAWNPKEGAALDFVAAGTCANSSNPAAFVDAFLPYTERMEKDYGGLTKQIIGKAEVTTRKIEERTIVKVQFPRGHGGEIHGVGTKKREIAGGFAPVDPAISDPASIVELNPIVHDETTEWGTEEDFTRITFDPNEEENEK
jgi:hypothetical protein